MKRRTFLALASGAAAWPVAARAQQPTPLVGWLSNMNAAADALVLPAFHEGLAAHGFTEGKNVTVVQRWTDGRLDRLPSLAAELVKQRVAVVVAVGDGVRASFATRGVSKTMPIVFVTGAYPVRVGLVPNLHRPGHNITGVTAYYRALAPKRLGILHELLPRSKTVAVLISPGLVAMSPEHVPELKSAALKVGKNVNVIEVPDEPGFSSALAALARDKSDALMVESNSLFLSRYQQIVAAATKLSIPTLYFRRVFVLGGGLMSYGSSSEGNYRVLGEYAGRVLKGEPAGDLPVQQPTKFELVMNLKTAAALGLTVPPTLLARADEVIE